MPRVVSFIVLLAILLLTGSVFYRVMLNFLVPLFLATVLVVIFKPLHEWICSKIRNRPNIAAVATTAAILLVVLLPTCWLLIQAYAECSSVLGALIKDDDRRQEMIATLEGRAGKYLESYKETFGHPLDLSEISERALQQAGALLVGSFQTLANLAIGLVIMVLSIYFFLVDGPKMTETLMRLSPLDDKYERELFDKFANVSRAVVVASLLSAIVQGLLAGIGYFFALGETAPIILLTMLTMMLAIVPFVGAAAVWAPVCIYIYLYFPFELPDGQIVPGDKSRAVVLAVYCATIVSTADNLIKPLVLHGQSNLHPLLALLSVLGGVQVLGPIGILVGPMLVAFLQALLNMLNKELHLLGNGAAEDVATDMATQPAAEDDAEVQASTASPAVESPEPSTGKAKRRKRGKRRK